MNFSSFKNWWSQSGVAPQDFGTSIPKLRQLGDAFVLQRDLATVAVPWGASQASLQRDGFQFAQKTDERVSLLITTAPCFGVDLAHIEVFRNGELVDRPIVQVWYAIRSSPQISHRAQAEEIQARFVRVWGQPNEGESIPSFEERKGSDSVAAYAEWRHAGVRAGLSWFGSRRRAHGAMTSGFISFEWVDLLAMARPFMRSALQSQQMLDSLNTPRPLARLRMPRIGLHEQTYLTSSLLASKASLKQLRAYRALYEPNLLTTSDRLKELVNSEDELLLWDAGDMWGVSSRKDTVLAGGNDSLAVRWDHVTPARGGGFEALNIGSLHAEGPAKDLKECGDIQAFVDALKQFSEVRYSFEQFTDE